VTPLGARTDAYYDIAFSEHGIMNPLSEQTVRFAARTCGLSDGSRILDIGSGKGYVSFLLAREFGAHCTLVDRSARWLAEARSLFERAGLAHRVRCVEGDAAAFRAGSSTFDAVLCLGTTPIYGRFSDAIATLRPALATGGSLLVGEATIDARLPPPYRTYLRRQGWAYHTTRELLAAAAGEGLDIIAALRSDRAEWDRYMSLQWQAVDAHARAHPDDPDARFFLRWMTADRAMYLRYQRNLMSWTVYVLREA
jgi:cyclopropane fatty-acyl-phospholipid synthase-like methyltransferase